MIFFFYEEFCHEEEAYIVYKENSTKQKCDLLHGFKVDTQLLMKTGTKRGFTMPKQVSNEVVRTKKIEVKKIFPLPFFHHLILAEVLMTTKLTLLE